MSDAKKGKPLTITRRRGDIFDMAKDGTSIPGDAGKQRTIPSVPNPHQVTEDNTERGEIAGAPTLAGAADNPTDMPRNPRDMAGNSEAVTGMGDQMAGEAGTKNLHYKSGEPEAKGSQRYGKHVQDKESIYDEPAVENAKNV